MEPSRILFASWHFYLDMTNGASISVRELLRATSKRGWKANVFCGSAVDSQSSADAWNILKSLKINPRTIVNENEQYPFSILSFNDYGIQSRVFCPKQGSFTPDPFSCALFLKFLNLALESLHPDVVLTYGDFGMAPPILKAIRSHGARSVFMLQNFAYCNADSKEMLMNADLVITPSEYAANFYKNELNLQTTVLPPLITWKSLTAPISSEGVAQRYVLFVNPGENKGVRLFARVASEMARLRPDIPFLVVEGSSKAGSLFEIEVDLKAGHNVFTMSNVTPAWKFYRHAKITLVPSFFNESFGRVAAESMIAGIPVIASDRGALPETVGEAGTLLHIPEKYTPSAGLNPTTEEVRDWIDEIVKLWDDEEYYAQRQQLCIARATRWNEDVVTDLYEAAFRRLFVIK